MEGRACSIAYNFLVNKNEEKAEPRQIAVNRRARFDYFIEDRYEAGLALQGWEVKSMREGRAQVAEAYVRIIKREAWLVGAHFNPPSTLSTHTHADPTRSRKLLMHREQLDKLTGKVERAGYTLVPLDLHWTHGRAKLSVGLAKGKKTHDKRATIKERDWNREKSRILRRG